MGRLFSDPEEFSRQAEKERSRADNRQGCCRRFGNRSQLKTLKAGERRARSRRKVWPYQDQIGGAKLSSVVPRLLVRRAVGGIPDANLCAYPIGRWHQPTPCHKMTPTVECRGRERLVKACRSETVCGCVGIAAPEKIGQVRGWPDYSDPGRVRDGGVYTRRQVGEDDFALTVTAQRQ